MIRGVPESICRVAGPFISVADCVYFSRRVDPSLFCYLRNARKLPCAQQHRQPRNDSVNGELRMGSFGGIGKNSSSQVRSSSPIDEIQFGTVVVNRDPPSLASNCLRKDVPRASTAGNAPGSAPQTLTASLDGEQRGEGSKLGSKASPLSVEGTSGILQNTHSQVTLKRSSQHWQKGRGQLPFGSGEAIEDSIQETPSSYIDDHDFPPLSADSSGRHRESSREGRGRGRAEEVQTHPPGEPQQLQHTGAERERPSRNYNHNGRSVHHDRRNAGDPNIAELRNGQEIGDRRDGRHNRPGRDPAWENAKSIDALGRALTGILRHKAVELHLKMSSDGYVNVQDILKLSMKTSSNRPLTSHSIADIKQAVQQDKKQRFGIKDENGQLFIRAKQGHSMESVKTEHLLKPIVSADEVPVCVHGTYRRYLDLIFKEGLKRMKRNHVHFAPGFPGSENVISGMRRTCEVLIYLNVNMALADGMKLYISENKVILTDGFDGVVPPKYFKEVLGLPDMKPIPPPLFVGPA